MAPHVDCHFACFVSAWTHDELRSTAWSWLPSDGRHRSRPKDDDISRCVLNKDQDEQDGDEESVTESKGEQGPYHNHEPDRRTVESVGATIPAYEFFFQQIISFRRV